MSSQKIHNAFKISLSFNLTGKQRIYLEWFLLFIFFILFSAASMAQNDLHDLNFQAQSEFQPTIKDAIKFSDLPEIKDSVKRISNIKYGITSRPMFAKYQVQTIEPAKIQNEPLTKLYRSLLKAGYGPIYNMPYGEFWISNTRSRDNSDGAHLKHFSSSAHLRDVGYSGFSENQASVFGKRFYKKHTLSGDLKYERNVVHYYGYDTTINKLDDKKYTRQRYQLIEPKIMLQSHYADSTHVNHNIGLSFYNLQNLYREAENNIRLDARGNLFLNKEKLNINFLTDYYNHKQANDTINDLIMSLSPSFEAGGKKWHAEIGLTGTLDNFGAATRFYFYPLLNINYDVYEGLVIPYAGLNGGLIKNSFRRLSTENFFVDTTIHYANTNNKINAFGGLKGNISSNTSYDARVSYSQFDSLHFFAIDYSGTNQVYNRFDVIYDNATLINVTGEVQYRFKEKINLIGKGNYYLYTPKNLERAYHKPEFDMTYSFIYNLKSKIILRADLFVMGTQWARTLVTESTGPVLKSKLLPGWADMNLEAEYRYSKMLSFFARFNNIANQRYYRWERYPSQRFNFMAGITFVPF
jgi:hypothetical protein